MTRVKKAIFLILFVAFLHQLSRFFDNIFVSVNIQFEHDSQPACKNEIAEWVFKLDVAFYYTTYYIFRIFFVFIIPSVALITLNCLLFRALKRAENKRTELLQTRFKLTESGFDQANPKSSFGPELLPAGRQSGSAELTNQITHIQPNQLAPPDNLGRKLAKAGSGKKKKFFISSLQISRRKSSAKRARKKLQPRPTSGSPSNQISCSTFEEKLSNVLSTNESNQSNARRGNLIMKQKSDDSNYSCPASGAQTQTSTVSRKGEVGRQTNGNRLESRAGSLEEQELDFTCADCAACERNEMLECHHCATQEGATDRNQLHQAVSQCSSLMGGATNTTNEDGSSCLATQNASSSMFAVGPNDATLENASIRDGLEVEDEQEQVYLREPEVKLEKLKKSGSVDSRLVCGCLSKNQQLTGSGLRRASSSKKNVCRECCLSDECQPEVGAEREASNKCADSCADSEQSVEANCEPSEEKELARRRKLKAELGSQTEPLLSSSQSDCANKAVLEQQQQQPATLYSTNTNTNSSGSLLQPTKPQLEQASKNSLAISLTSGRNRLNSNPAGNSVGQTSHSIRTMDSNRTTLMLIVVVTVFLMVEVPVAIVTILHVVTNSFEVFQEVELGPRFNYIKLFTNFVIMISYSVNFTIYCSMSKKFRETFRDLIFCGRRGRKKRLQMMNLQRNQLTSHNQFQFQASTNQLDNQLTSFANNNSPNRCAHSKNSLPAEPNSNSLLQYYPYRSLKNNSQQQECEL